MPDIRDVLILGAGVCGLKAAGDLYQGKRRVLVLDKGRGVGGRAATRRWDDVPVDHGAQFFTVRTPAFRAQTARWLAQGVCFPWTPGFHQWDDDGRGLRAPDPDDRGHPRYACAAGMSALGKVLSHAVPPDAIRLNARVSALRLVDDEWGRYWRAEIEGAPPEAEVLAARKLIMTLPVPQALELLDKSGLVDVLDAEALGALRTVEVAPTLAILLRGEAPRPDWQGIQLRDETLSWIGTDSDKRREMAGLEVFVLHASAEFSRRWQDGDLEEAGRLVVARAGEIVGDWITRLPDRQVHRWRYASVKQGLEDWAGSRLSRAEDPALFLAGDAFLGAKIEGAYLSGQEAARVILAEPKLDRAVLPKPAVWPPAPPLRGSQPGLYPPEKPLERRG